VVRGVYLLAVSLVHSVVFKRLCTWRLVCSV